MMAGRSKDIEELLSALLDDELSEADRLRAVQLLREDADARRLHDDLRRNREELGSLPRHAAPATLVGDIRAQLERQALLESESAEPGSSTGRVRGWWWALTSAAAMVGLVALGTMWFRTTQESDQYGSSTRLAVKDAAEGKSPKTEGAGRQDLGESLATAERGRDAETPGPRAGGRESGVDKSAGAMTPRVEVRASRAAPFAERLETKNAASALEGQLLAMSDAERKLSVGLPPAALSDHKFENESLRLVVRAASDRRRDAMLQKLERDLLVLGAVNVESPTAADAASPQAGRMLVRGKAGRNFADDPAGASEVLVRIPGRELGELVERVSSRVVASEAVELESGPLLITGSEAIQSTLRRHATADRRKALAPTILSGGSEQVRDEEVDAPAGEMATASADKAGKRPFWPWGGLLPIVGLDEAAISSAGGETTSSTSLEEPVGPKYEVASAAVDVADAGDGAAGKGGSLVERRLEKLRPAPATDNPRTVAADHYVTLVIRFEAAKPQPAPIRSEDPTAAPGGATDKPIQK